MLVNLTKRPLLLYDTDGAVVELAPDPRHLGLVAIGEHRTVAGADGHTFSLNVQTVKEVKGLPEPDGAVYIVPVEIAMALQATRDDVVFPAEEAQVRDAAGQLRRITHLRRIVPKLS